MIRCEYARSDVLVSVAAPVAWSTVVRTQDRVIRSSWRRNRRTAHLPSETLELDPPSLYVPPRIPRAPPRIHHPCARPPRCAQLALHAQRLDVRGGVARALQRTSKRPRHRAPSRAQQPRHGVRVARAARGGHVHEQEVSGDVRTLARRSHGQARRGPGPPTRRCAGRARA
jgi:hypothetical protein